MLKGNADCTRGGLLPLQPELVPNRLEAVAPLLQRAKVLRKPRHRGCAQLLPVVVSAVVVKQRLAERVLELAHLRLLDGLRGGGLLLLLLLEDRLWFLVLLV